MKKIIATVLAMVMALALCTVAFAAEKYELVQISDTAKEKKEIATVAVTNASTTTTDGVVSGSVAMYTLTGATGVTLTDTKFVDASAENATYILYKDGAVYKYLVATDNDGKYNYVGEIYKTFGSKCGEMKKDDSVKDKTFFTAKDGAKTTNYYVEDTAGTIYLLVNNEVVKVKQAKKGTDYTVVPHDFTKASGATYTFAADGTLATAKCATCGAVYTYTKYYTVADAAKDSVAIAANALYTGSPEGYLYTGSTTNPSTDKNTKPSPKTFDAGIAMYVGMALTSVAGSAVVIGKKKEF